MFQFTTLGRPGRRTFLASFAMGLGRNLRFLSAGDVLLYDLVIYSRAAVKIFSIVSRVSSATVVPSNSVLQISFPRFDYIHSLASLCFAQH